MPLFARTLRSPFSKLMNSLKNENTLINEKLISLSTEACKIEHGLTGFRNGYDSKLNSPLELLSALLEDVKCDETCEWVFSNI